MRPVSRIGLCLIVLALSGTSVSHASTTAEPGTKLYIGQSAHLTAEIPGDWTVEGDSRYDYQGARGFLASYPLTGLTLDETCATVAASEPFSGSDTRVVATTWSGQPACRIDGSTDDGPASALVVPHPYPFESSGEQITYAALMTDADHFMAISTTLTFSSDRVTPEAYVTSVLDLLEARAYFADEVDWELARQVALVGIDGITDLSLAQGVVNDLVATLRSAGDNHSYVLSPSQSASQGEVTGFGFLVGDRRVLQVYPDGPADRAGVRAGDLIEAVDDRPFLPTLNAIDPAALIGANAQLTLRRRGVAELITVTVEQGPYSQYAVPTGRRLSGDLGYIEVPHFTTPGREADYVEAARSVVGTVDQSPTCGWLIDLRLNTGGRYPPMVGGVGPILDDGIFVGWQQRDGTQTWVTYADGQITDDGQPVADFADQADSALQRPSPPVAVLTGPLTGSSGEVAALAFVGRPETRLFGEATAGATTAISGFTLFDGTTIGLATAAMADRSGTTHLAGIEPDEHIRIDWETFGTDDDPVIQAAMTWLDRQPGCTDGTLAP